MVYPLESGEVMVNLVEPHIVTLIGSATALSDTPTCICFTYYYDPVKLANHCH